MKEKTLGILGGMGPLASTGFLKTIYEQNLGSWPEQSYPDVILHSISSVPDRSASFAGNREDELFERLYKNVKTLNDTNVSKIVICCITSHYYLPRLPPEISAKIISLIDVIIGSLMATKRPALLLATSGTYQKELFFTPAHRNAKEYILIPDDTDKARIHKIIYDKLKPGKNTASVYPEIKELLRKYGTDTFIAGCTEFHNLVAYLLSQGINDISFIDPLLIIAKNLKAIMGDNFKQS